MLNRLKNIKQALNEMSVRLASNTELQKLLVIDGENLNVDFSPKSIQEMLNEKYINTTPQTLNAIKEVGRNVFLILTINNIELKSSEGNIRVRGNIHIVTDTNHILIENNKDRGLEIADLILTALDGLKISSSVVVEFSSISKTNYSELFTGYSMNFTFADLHSKPVEM